MGASSAPGRSEATASPPAERVDSGPPLTREYTRLLGLQEHLRLQLERIQSELDAPSARGMVEEVRSRSDSGLPDALRCVREAIAGAVERLVEAERELRELLESDPGELTIEGVVNLPLRLARFIAERMNLPGFHYEVREDEVRGWIIIWKEYGREGTVRGSGRFYERPYAWLDE